MEKNLILTGWGIPEYVAAAAVAFKALSGHADVMGVSRRRCQNCWMRLMTHGRMSTCSACL